MNVVLDDAEEVWTKSTKSKKQGDRNHLGSFAPVSCPTSYAYADHGYHVDGHRSAVTQGRKHHFDSTSDTLVQRLKNAVDLDFISLLLCCFPLCVLYSPPSFLSAVLG